MIRDFQAAFRVSNIRKALILLWSAVLTVAAWVGFEGVMLGAIWASILLSAAWAWCEPMPVVHLHVDSDYQAWLLLREDEAVLYEAQLLSGSLIHPYLCCLKWRLPEKIVWQWVWLDSADSESLRRLRVWAKFGVAQK